PPYLCPDTRYFAEGIGQPGKKRGQTRPCDHHSYGGGHHDYGSFGGYFHSTMTQHLIGRLGRLQQPVAKAGGPGSRPFQRPPCARRGRSAPAPFLTPCPTYDKTRARSNRYVKERPVANLVLNVFQVDFDSGR